MKLELEVQELNWLLKNIKSELQDAEKITDLNWAWYYVGKNDKLRAIKHYKIATGCTLPQAKEFMDNVFIQVETGTNI